MSELSVKEFWYSYGKPLAKFYYIGESTKIEEWYSPLDGNKMKFSRSFVNNSKDGVQYEWFPSGQLKSIQRYKAGELHGYNEAWFHKRSNEPEQYECKETYVDGKLHGINKDSFWNYEGLVERNKFNIYGDTVSSDIYQTFVNNVKSVAHNIISIKDLALLVISFL